MEQNSVLATTSQRYKFLIQLPTGLDLKRCYLTGAEISIYFPYFFVQVHAPSSNYTAPCIYYTHTTVRPTPPAPLRTINYNLNPEEPFYSLILVTHGNIQNLGILSFMTSFLYGINPWESSWFIFGT